MKKTVVLTLIALLMLGSAAIAGKEKLPKEVKFNKYTTPSSTVMVGVISKAADPAYLTSKIDKPEVVRFYGFTTGVSEEKGSFRLGVVLSDLKISLKASDKDKVVSSLRSIAKVLLGLGAPIPMMESVFNLKSAVEAGVKLEAIRKASLPILEPFIEDFIEKEGKMVYLRFGEWVEATRLAALAGEKGNTQLFTNVIKKMNPAEYFLTELKDKGMTKGAAESLTILSELKSKDKIGQRQIKKALQATNTIISSMG